MIKALKHKFIMIFFEWRHVHQTSQPDGENIQGKQAHYKQPPQIYPMGDRLLGVPL